MRGCCNSEIAAGAMGQPDGAQLRFGRHQPDRFAEGHMDGDEQDPQLLIRQHHGKIGGPRLRGQDLGMAGVIDARRLHRLLVQRRGDDGIDLAGLGEADRALDIGESGRTRPRIDAPEGEIGGQPTRRQEIHLPGAGFGLGGCRDDAQRQPGAHDTDGAMRIASSPMTKAGGKPPSAQSLATTSGPMPAGSPMVRWLR